MRAPSLAEEIVLLSLDDATGRPLGRAGMAPDLALAGALLMDLALAGRIDTDRDRLVLVDTTPTGDSVADAALLRLAAPEVPHDVRGLIPLLAQDAAKARQALLARLVEAGVLKRVEERVLFVFADRRFPKTPGRAEAADARARLRRTLLDAEIPAPKDALLLGLVRAAGLLPAIFTPEELGRVQPWLVTVTGIESLNRSLGRAVADVLAVRLAS